MRDETLKEHIEKIHKEHYKQGQTDFCETFIKVIEVMDKTGQEKHTTAQVLEFIAMVEGLLNKEET